MFASILNLDDFRGRHDQIQNSHLVGKQKKNIKSNSYFYHLSTAAINLNSQLQNQLEIKVFDITKEYKQIVIGPKDALILFEDWDKELDQLKKLAVRWYAFLYTFSNFYSSNLVKKNAWVTRLLLFKEITDHPCPLELLVKGILLKGQVDLIPYIKEWQKKVDTWNRNMGSHKEVISFENEMLLELENVGELRNFDHIFKTVAKTFNDQYQTTLSKMIAKLIPNKEIEGPTILKLNI